MNNQSIKLLCALLSMPLASHAMLRNAVTKMPLARMQLPSMVVRTVAKWSKEPWHVSKPVAPQWQSLTDRLEQDYQNDDLWVPYSDPEARKFVTAQSQSLEARLVGLQDHLDNVVWTPYNKNRKLDIEKDIFELRMKLAKVAKPSEEKK